MEPSTLNPPWAFPIVCSIILTSFILRGCAKQSFLPA